MKTLKASGPGLVAQRCRNEEGVYDKIEFIISISAMDDQRFAEYCHHLFKLQEWCTMNDGCYATDDIKIDEEIRPYLKKKPLILKPVNAKECEEFLLTKSISDPANMARQSIDDNHMYSKELFLDGINSLSFDQFQEFCKHTREVDHAFASNGGCQLTLQNGLIPEKMKSETGPYWKFEYPYKTRNL
jgi:hypothetical protein